MSALGAVKLSVAGADILGACDKGSCHRNPPPGGVSSRDDRPCPVALLARLSQESGRAWYRCGWSCLEEHPLAAPVEEFLVDLANAGRSPHTVRGYRDDLAGSAAAHTGGVGEITVAVLRDWLAPLYSR